MENRENRRVAATKRRLRKAIVELRKPLGVRKVSVSDLCQKANINRTTFYNHYECTDDVLKEVLDQYYMDMNGLVSDVKLGNKENMKQQIIAVFKYIYEHKDESQVIFGENLRDTYTKQLFLAPGFRRIWDKKLENVKSEQEKDGLLAFVFSGLFSLIHDWVNADKVMEPEAEAQFVQKLIGRVFSQR